MLNDGCVTVGDESEVGVREAGEARVIQEVAHGYPSGIDFDHRNQCVLH